ncbi:MAG TPA: hypothetical protein VKW08_20695 [Xanthobacteraceae bacterium]|nr:hypothetical protein [Xanthobacteraceae bacterium]
MLRLLLARLGAGMLRILTAFGRILGEDNGSRNLRDPLHGQEALCQGDRGDRGERQQGISSG